MGILLFFVFIELLLLIWQIREGVLTFGEFCTISICDFVLIMVLGFMLTSVFLSWRPIHYEFVEENRLISFDDTYYVSGTVGTEGNLKYVVMIETEKGYEAKELGASICSISYTIEEPTLIKEKAVFDSDLLNWIFFKNVKERYKICIHEDTILMKYYDAKSA